MSTSILKNSPNTKHNTIIKKQTMFNKIINQLLQQNIYLIYFIILTSSNTHANNKISLYHNCTEKWNFEEKNTKIISIKPIGNNCYNKCNNECSIFNTKIKNNNEKISLINKNQIPESNLNKDIIEECIYTCRNGKIFSSKYRETNPEIKSAKQFIFKKKISTKSYCNTNKTSPESPDYAFFSSNILVKANETINLFLLFIFITKTTEQNNTIYLCGYKTVKLFPSFKSYSRKDWNNNKNKWLFSQNQNIENWNARNNIWTNTGINIKDGDYLMIRYSGNFFNGKSVILNKLKDESNYKLQIKIKINNKNKYYLLPGDKLKTAEISIPLNCNNENYLQCKNIKYKNYKKIKEYNEKYKWYGLNPKTNIETNPMLAIPEQIDNDIIKFITSNNQYLEQYKVYTFSGNIKNFSKKPAKLYIRHNIRNKKLNLKHALGGLNVEIIWRGCSYFNGDRLQYAVVPPIKNKMQNKEYRPEAKNIKWHDIPKMNIMHNIPFKIKNKNKGQLFFKIKKLKKTHNTNTIDPHFKKNILYLNNSTLANNKYKRANTTGEYIISVSKINTENNIKKNISTIINNIYNQIVGTKNKKSIITNIIEQILIHSKFIKIIKALITIYISYTGITFLIGIKTINQKEIIKKIIKIAIIITLISQNSIKFFTINIEKFLNQGINKLFIKTINPIYSNIKI